jgi:hypothetical protein
MYEELQTVGDPDLVKDNAQNGTQSAVSFMLLLSSLSSLNEQLN